MDLLSEAYGGSTSDDDEGGPAGAGGDDRIALPLPLLKRPRLEGRPPQSRFQVTPHPPRAPIAEPSSSYGCSGRYVSKRERALLSATVPAPPTSSPPHPTAAVDFTVLDYRPDSLALVDVAKLKQRQLKPASAGNTPTKVSVSLKGHTKAVNSIHWSQANVHLLASAGTDQTVRVWNVWSKEQPTAHIFRHHKSAVKDVRWCPHQPALLSSSYDSTVQLIDIQEGKVTEVFKENQVVQTIKFHPTDSNLFLCGGSQGSLKLWDLRSHSMVKEYQRAGLGQIYSIDFSVDGKQFISSTDTTLSSKSEDSIIVWDLSRQVPLSNQVYTEAFTCPCVRYHPKESSFVAQSNGNYIAIFSARPPFKMNKYSRFEGHGVWGFPVKCDFSPDGRELASGSSDGCTYIYDFKTSRCSRKIQLFAEECIDVTYHPSMPDVIACCSWSGSICIMDCR